MLATLAVMDKACRSVTIISQLLVNKTTEAGVRRHKTRLLASFRVSPQLELTQF